MTDRVAASYTVANPPPASPVKIVSAAQLTSIMATPASTAPPPGLQDVTPGGHRRLVARRDPDRHRPGYAHGQTCGRGDVAGWGTGTD